MKLVLVAKIANVNPILDFFAKDSRFTLSNSGIGIDIFALNYYTGIFIDSGEIRLEEDLLDPDCEDEKGLLESNLIKEISDLAKRINSGDFSELANLADLIFNLKSIEMKKGNNGYL